ncbi:DUF4433 domain-containing protein [Euzebya sp.]|uniref:type II toxin-antitoxin system toxin DNA ADP-ribosyl transferase DarT n=1 Tax=Euzebya sp. TaxID=1971409 RepID=UPI0035154375
MPRPIPTLLYHFTHIDHLPAIARHGLVADVTAAGDGLLRQEVGNHEIKQRRRSRTVPVPPGGVVADYVPFYFAPRSPMMYAIDCGNVPEYAGGIDPLVYLVTDVDRLVALGMSPVVTDRNAVLAIAAFTTELARLDDLVDWQLMRQRMWNNTVDEPDRRERRMAECLVHGLVPWEAFTAIHVRTANRRTQADALLAARPHPPIHVTPGMYF